MTVEQYAQASNIICACVVLVVSFWIQRDHSSVFFRQWLLAYAIATAMLLWDVPSLMLGRPVWACVVQVLLCVASAWHFAKAALLLVEKPWPSWILWTLLGLSAAGSAVALSLGVPFSTVSAPPLLLFTASVIGLGVTFFRVIGRSRGVRLGWLGATFVALGAIPLAYPFLVGTPGFVIGLGAASVAHLAVGFGMVFFLLDEVIRQVREENSRLLAQERARSNFLSTVSHELRTPLTSIMGNLEFLEDGLGGELTLQQATFTREMRHGTDHLAHLIESLLDSSQINAGALSVKKQAVDLPGCVQAAAGTIGPIADKRGVHVHLNLPDRLPEVDGDPQRLVQVLINLLGNAVKFTPPGGEVAVSAGIREGNIWVAVTDTGIGIPPERVDQIFEPFFQVDNSLTREHSGSGLGLWIVKNLVTAMGGQISVESHPGEGSTFRITLAMATDGPSMAGTGDLNFSVGQMP